MKRVIALLLALALTLCVGALADVTLEDINAVNAVSHESMRAKVRCDLNVSMLINDDSDALPFTIEGETLVKGERAALHLTIESVLFGRVQLDGYLNNGVMAIYLDGEYMDTTEMEGLDDLLAPTSFPEGGALTPEGSGWKITYPPESLFPDLAELEPYLSDLTLEGDAAYTFDEALVWTGFALTVQRFSLSVEGASLDISGSVALSPITFDDVSDAELARPSTSGSDMKSA